MIRGSHLGCPRKARSSGSGWKCPHTLTHWEPKGAERSLAVLGLAMEDTVWSPKAGVCWVGVVSQFTQCCLWEGRHAPAQQTRAPWGGRGALPSCHPAVGPEFGELVQKFRSCLCPFAEVHSAYTSPSPPVPGDFDREEDCSLDIPYMNVTCVLLHERLRRVWC